VPQVTREAYDFLHDKTKTNMIAEIQKATELNRNNLEAYYLGRFLGLDFGRQILTHDQLCKAIEEISSDFFRDYAKLYPEAPKLYPKTAQPQPEAVKAE
jgi:hypothetical protein